MMKKRNLTADTYKKIYNSNFFRETDIYMDKFWFEMQNKTDEEINKMTRKELILLGQKKDKNELEDLKNMIFNKKPDSLYPLYIEYFGSLEVEYPFLAETVIEWFFYCFPEISKKRIEIFFLNITKETVLRTKSRHEKKINFTDHEATDKYMFQIEKYDTEIIERLSKLYFAGFKTLFKTDNLFCLTFDLFSLKYIIYALNEHMRNTNNNKFKTMVENIVFPLVKESLKNYESVTKMNFSFSVDKKKGEIDLFCIVENILYIFEFKNTREFSNPIVKNFSYFKDWINQSYLKSHSQLLFCIENHKKIFKNFDYEKIIPITISTSQNRFLPITFETFCPGLQKLASWVIGDIDSLLFLLPNFATWNIIQTISRVYNLRGLMAFIYDWVDLVGIILSVKMRDADHVHFFSETLVTAVLTTYSQEGKFQNKNMAIEWEGNYREFYKFLNLALEKMHPDRFLFLKHELVILKHESVHLKIKVAKCLFNGDAFYEKGKYSFFIGKKPFKQKDIVFFLAEDQKYSSELNALLSFMKQHKLP